MDLKRIPANQIEKQKRLGSGGYGTVFQGRWRTSSKSITVAIKVLHLHHLEKDVQAELFCEAKVMSDLKGKGVVLFHGISQIKKAYALVMEYMPRGDLETLLKNHKASNPLRDL